MMRLSIFVGISVVLFEHFGQGVVRIAQNNPSDMPKATIRRNTRFENAHSLVLTSFPGMSLEQCISACTSRPGCTAVEYRNLVKHCSLYTAISTTVMSPGFLTLSGLNTARQCGRRTCGPNEVCETSTGTCMVKECGYPNGNSAIIGNRFELGSVVLASKVSGRTAERIRCTANGEWASMGKLWNTYQGITCRDIRQRYPHVETGVYVNQLNMTIYCDFDTDGGAWLVFQRRQDGSVDFYRNWEDYKMGFGAMNGEFWLGLENLHTILRSSSPARFELRVDLEDWDGDKRYADYASFDLSDESDGYRHTCVKYTGTAGDALDRRPQSVNGQMFTTKDRDNDRRPEFNCAELYKGAWWYNHCHSANLNGIYHAGGHLETLGIGLSWYPWRKNWYSMKKTAMKIREKSGT